jgi:hypothetical protein
MGRLEPVRSGCGRGASEPSFARARDGRQGCCGRPTGARDRVGRPQRRSDRLADLGVACDRSMAIKGARGRIPAPQGRVRTQGSRPAAPPLSDSHGPLRVPTLGRCPCAAADERMEQALSGSLGASERSARTGSSLRPFSGDCWRARERKLRKSLTVSEHASRRRRCRCADCPVRAPRSALWPSDATNAFRSVQGRVRSTAPILMARKPQCYATA